MKMQKFRNLDDIFPLEEAKIKNKNKYILYYGMT